ncbi:MULTISPECIES: TetR/AcrR family transcriptional regulator [unclassified Nocardioides]|uniref:TetR/AcrR family transcriptional regulator n=1 Tax=Nocardioides sp. URHA0032 TaxID=1380388 RepID=UPI00068649F0|nr:TetR/AcrR family transcriptional regulator [Nocardioides sp. URHA0032]
MSTSQGEPRRGRGRPRTPGAEKRIIDAALEEYGEHGWSGFTMDGVARRAGVGKSTVYLRWQDKDTLLTDAVGTSSGQLGAVDTGSLRGDLHQVAVNLFEHFREPAGWATLRITIDTAGAPQRLGRFSEAVADVQVDNIERILQRAGARGDKIEGVSPNAVAECIYGSVIMQTLGFRLEDRELDAQEIDRRATELVGVVMDGALSGATRTDG